MLRKHSHTIAMINRDRTAAYLVRDYFSLRRGTTLMSSLCENKLGQADLVLCLLRLRDTHHYRMLGVYVHLLVGHAIVVGPRCLLQYRCNGAPTATVVRSLMDRRIVSVADVPNPRKARTEAYYRWTDFRVGRTPRQLISRGATRRDVKRAMRKGWIVLEDAK